MDENTPHDWWTSAGAAVAGIGGALIGLAGAGVAVWSRIRTTKSDADKSKIDVLKASQELLLTAMARQDERYNSACKQMEERELQMQSIITEIRKEAQARYDEINAEHKRCLQGNSERDGRIAELTRLHEDLIRQTVDLRAEIAKAHGRRTVRMPPEKEPSSGDTKGI